MKLVFRSLTRDLRTAVNNARDYIYREAKINRRLKAALPLFIYQQGKVGSSSLEHSLVPTWPGLTVVSHSLTPAEGETIELIGMRELVVKKRKPYLIISMVREPIARNISAFFENYDRKIGTTAGARANLSVDEMIAIFLTTYNHDHPLTWFDNRMKPDCGIDVFNYEFPAGGVQVIEHNHVRMLLMRSEIDDEVKESAVKDFLGTKDFRLKRVNDASQKAYIETYRLFREKFIPPDWYIEKMYESRYFKHFYAGQKDQFIAKWHRPQVTSKPASTAAKAA